jgi:hypothetical protein
MPLGGWKEVIEALTARVDALEAKASIPAQSSVASVPLLDGNGNPVNDALGNPIFVDHSEA